MNKRLTSIIVSALLLTCKAAAQTNWTPVAPYPPRLPQVISTEVINSKAYFLCEGNLVYSTSDSGHTFTEYPQYAPTNNIVSGFNFMQGIAFADSLTGYIVDPAHGEFRTTDGGFTWKQKAQAGSNISMVTFGSSKTGWKLGIGGFYKTTDAGETWNYINAPFFGDFSNFDGYFSKICALDENNVWILKTKQLPAGKSGPVWHSTNGGMNWINTFTGLSSDSMNQVTYEDFVMRPSGAGCITGTIFNPTVNYDSIRAFVLITNNFGETWNRKDFPNEDYTCVNSISDSIWVLLGNSRLHSYDTWGQSIERRTTNMGESWTYSPAFGSDTIQNQHFYSAAYIPQLNTILASTTFGTYKSSDQGKSFPKITSERDMLVNFIAIDKRSSSSRDQIIVCPSYGLDYLISIDGGSNWTRKQLPGYIMTTMRDLQVTNGKIYQIVYDYQGNFKLASSTDFGQTWSSTSVPSYGALRGLSVSGEDTILIQAYPNMAMSVNSGKTWSQGPVLGTFWVNESQIMGNGKIIAAGGFYDTTATKGMIYTSADAGSNWRIQDFPAELNQIKMITEMTGFSAGTDAKLYRTNDGGNTWNFVLGNVYTVAFIDSMRGIASNLQITTDGGVTWYPNIFPSLSTGNITSMEFTKSGDLLVAGNGNLFKYAGAVSLFPHAVSSKTYVSESPSVILEQNNPNPFNPSTNIEFYLPSSQLVQLKVYDILGREVKTLVNTTLNAGKYTFVFEGNNLANGVYFYRLTAGNFSMTKKMLLLK